MQHDVLRSRCSNLSLGASASQRIISDNPMHMMNREIIPGRKKRV